MKTLDRYILTSFVSAVLLWLVVGMSLRIVADLFINMDEFAKLGLPFGELVLYIARYYSLHSLVYFTELGGLLIVAAAAFTVYRMNHTNELTAMLASGVSLYRVIWPVILCAFLMSGLIVLDQELLIPRVAHELARDKDERVGREKFPVRLIVDGNGAVWYAKAFEQAPGAGSSGAQAHLVQAVILLRDDIGRLRASITADRCVPSHEDGQFGWAGTNAELSRVTGPNEPTWKYTQRSDRIYSDLTPERLLQAIRAGQGLNLRDELYRMTLTAKGLSREPAFDGKGPIWRLQEPRFHFADDQGRTLAVVRGREAIWRPRSGQEDPHWQIVDGSIFFPTDLSPRDLILRQTSRWLDFMSFSDLNELIESKKVVDRESAVMARFVRVANPINNVIMLLLALPFILSRERNIKASAGLTTAVVCGYFALVYACRYVGLDPFWATFSPIFVAGPVSVVMLDSIKT